MTIYEVNIRVLSESFEEYAEWLDGHIREMLELDGFIAANWLEVEEDEEAKELEEAVRQAVRLDESVPAELREAAATPVNTRLLTIQYRLRDRESLDRYFADHAQRMRQDGKERFGDMFAATRRIMHLVNRY